MGLHTPFTSDALSPAIGSGNSNARYQYGGAQTWAQTPSQKRVGDQRTSGYFQSPIDVGRFLLVSFLPHEPASADTVAHWIPRDCIFRGDLCPHQRESAGCFTLFAS
jgi:hypothetical protein